jgi:hypothetical protein
MLRGIRSHLTYANVMATAAVFIALGGASYAAIKLPKNSVGASQIKKDAITGSKVRDGSLTGSDVKNGSLSAKDFGGALPAGQAGPQGVQGPQGSQGPKGDQGDAGTPGTARAYATMRPDECFHTNNTCTIYNVKNVASIRLVATGTYCVAPAPGLSFAGVTPALTTDAYNSGPDNGAGTPIVAYSSFLYGQCATDEIRVTTYRATGTTPTVALSNSTSFGIVIP